MAAKPKVVVLATGGTIASRYDPALGRTVASQRAEDLLRTLPKAAEVAEVELDNFATIPSFDMSVGFAFDMAMRANALLARADVTEMVVQACRDEHIDRLLHMSAFRADADHGPSRYLRSKGRAERFVREEGGPDFRWTIFQPSVIFGDGDSFVSGLAAALRSAPLALPMVAPGARVSPVWVGDVVEAMLKALGDDDTAGESYQLCGPEVFTLWRLTTLLRDDLGLRKPVIPLPRPLSRLVATVMGFVPGSPLSVDSLARGYSASGDRAHATEAYRALAREFYRATDEPGAHDRIEGIELIDKVIQIDQSPIGRTPRSNPATYTGLFTFIRTRSAKAMKPWTSSRK